MIAEMNLHRKKDPILSESNKEYSSHIILKEPTKGMKKKTQKKQTLHSTFSEQFIVNILFDLVYCLNSEVFRR